MTIKILALASVIAVGYTVELRAQDAFAGTYGGLSFSFEREDSGSSGSDKTKLLDRSNVGLYVGHNFTNSGSGFVWGPEMATSTSLRRGKDSSGNKKRNFSLEARVRAGWANDKLFVYGLAGADLGRGGKGKDIKATSNFGVGAEFVVADEWSLRVDADQMDLNLGRKSGSKKGSSFGIDRVTFGITRKF